MIRRRRAALVVCLAIVGCAHPPAAAPLRLDVGTVAVFPPNNLTGDTLLVAGASLLEKYVLSTDRVTVPDLLAAEARFQLGRRGFSVFAPETVDAVTALHPPASADDAVAIAAKHELDGAVLYIELRRWEADAPFHPTYVIASLDAILLDVASGRALWKAARPSRPIPTRGVVNLGDAYAIAARAAMEELLKTLVAAAPQ